MKFMKNTPMFLYHFVRAKFFHRFCVYSASTKSRGGACIWALWKRDTNEIQEPLSFVDLTNFGNEVRKRDKRKDNPTSRRRGCHI